MRPSRRLIVPALFCLLLLAPTVPAQINPGRLTGTLVDEQGKPVGGVTLHLVEAEGQAGKPRPVKVNKKGRFAVSFLPAGRWKIETRDSSLFLKSMHYVHKNNIGMKTDEFEAKGHPATGLREFKLGVGGHGTLELVLADAGFRDQLAKQVALGEASGALQKTVALYKEGEMDSVVAETDKILKKSPDLAEARYMRGSALWQLQRFEEAETDLRVAIADNTELSQIHGILGTVLIERAKVLEAEGQEEAAIGLYTEAAELLAEEQKRSPDDVSVKTNRVVALDQAGLDDELVQALEELIEADPSNDRAAARLADIHAAAGRPDEATALMERVGLKGKDAGMILYNIAIGHYNRKDNPSALAAALRTLEADPEHVEVHRLLGYLKLSDGDSKGAVDEFKIYVERSPEGAETDTERQLIERLDLPGS